LLLFVDETDIQVYRWFDLVIVQYWSYTRLDSVICQGSFMASLSNFTPFWFLWTSNDTEICLLKNKVINRYKSLRIIQLLPNTKLRSIMSRKSVAWSFRYSEERDTRIWTDASPHSVSLRFAQHDRFYLRLQLGINPSREPEVR